MIWTEHVHQLVEDIVEAVYKNVMEPSGTDCVIQVTDKDMTWQEVQ